MTTKTGFTLIELLVVIAIIAVLAVVIVLSLNPAELLRQARDSNRVSDMATLKGAITLFEADVATTSVNALGTPGTIYVSSAAGSGASTTYNAPSPTWWGYAGGDSSVIVTSTARGVDGTGWIPVNFTAISSGAPIGNEPIDPSNNATNTTYTFVASSTAFKMAAKMESQKYGLGGSGDVVSTDGGQSTTTYEAGTNLSL